MDLVFLGTNDIGLRIYEWLCDRSDVSVKAMLTEPDQLDIVHSVDLDLLLSVGFDHLVPPEILEIPERGALNLHPSLLPYNGGKSPNVWPIIEGTPAGVTLHYMEKEFDTGPIIAQREVDIYFSDTGKDLHKRLEDAQFDLFTEVWPDIVSEDLEPTIQDTTEGTSHTTKDFLEACQLDPNERIRVEDLLNRLRALTFPPFDNATIEIGEEQYYIDIEIRSADDESAENSDGLISSYSDY